MSPSPQEHLARIREAGVVGAGGAGFPTHVKYGAQVEVVIANGAECEPLARVDQQLMAAEPAKVIRGLKLAMALTGAKQGIIGLKAKYKEAVARLQSVIEAPREKAQLALHQLDNFYPAGDEFVLVHEVLGRAIPEFGLPLDVGAVVSNVATLLDVAEAVEQQQPVTHRWVTVAGEVPRPATFRVPIGTPFSALLEAAGGAQAAAPRLISGGPMMGALVEDLEQPVTKTDSLLVVLDQGHPVIRRRTMTLERQIQLTRSACLKCMLCSELCPRNLLGHRLYPDRLMRNLAAGIAEDIEAFSGAYLCSECGLCATYSCVMNLDPCEANRMFKEKLRATGVPRPEPLAEARERSFVEMRRVPAIRLIARLGLSDYDRAAPISSFDVAVPRLKVPLKQHLGAPAVPVVKAGQTVQAGELLGEIKKGALGARIHAPLAARVAEITREAFILDVE